MKNLKSKIVCLLLVVSMMFLLFGCGMFGGTDRNKFLGTWSADADLTDVLNEMILQDTLANEDIADYINFNGFEITFIFTFNEDDTYSMSVDEASVNTAVDAVKRDLKDSFTQYLEDMLVEEGLTGFSVDDVLALSGISLDDLIDQSITNESIEDMVSGLNISGKWKAVGGKLYTSESVADEIDESTYDLYTITPAGIQLTLSDDSESVLDELQLLLTKVN